MEVSDSKVSVKAVAKRIAILSGTRPIHKKTDIKLLDFDKSQVMIYRKITQAKSQLDNVSRIKSFLPLESVRKLKFQQLELERTESIKRENIRLGNKIAIL